MVLLKKITAQTTVFLIGAAGYGLIEILWRGFTHFSMLLLGGTCLCFMNGLCQRCHQMHCLVKSALSCLFITAGEFCVGCIVNLWMKWNVWDYSEYRFNFMGQICLLYTVLWFLLSVPIILILDAICKKSFLPHLKKWLTEKNFFRRSNEKSRLGK